LNLRQKQFKIGQHMLMRTFIELKDGLYDLWDLKSITKESRYNDRHCRMEWILCLNRGSITKEFRDVEISYLSEKKRDLDYTKIKDFIEENESTQLIVASDIEKRLDSSYDTDDTMDDSDLEAIIEEE